MAQLLTVHEMISPEPSSLQAQYRGCVPTEQAVYFLSGERCSLSGLRGELLYETYEIACGLNNTVYGVVCSKQDLGGSGIIEEIPQFSAEKFVVSKGIGIPHGQVTIEIRLVGCERCPLSPVCHGSHMSCYDFDLRKINPEIGKEHGV